MPQHRPLFIIEIKNQFPFPVQGRGQGIGQRKIKNLYSSIGDLKMDCSLAGPTEIRLIGQAISSSIRFR